jgi:hypothetical protein
VLISYTVNLRGFYVGSSPSKNPKMGQWLRLAGFWNLARSTPFRKWLPSDVRVTTKGFAIEKVVQNKKQVRPVYTEKELLKDLTPHTAHADLLPTLNSHEAGYE